MKIKKRHVKVKLIQMTSLILLISITVILTGCTNIFSSVKAKDLTKQMVPSKVNGKAIDDQFVNNTADFAIDLFKRSIDKEKNSLVSPISVMYALAMTANGADGETLSQMEKVLGKDISMDELNQYLYYYTNILPKEDKAKVSIANSIWFRDDESSLVVEKDFLQKNADYYKAQIYKAPFNDRTLTDVNNWVKRYTDNMIDKIIDEIDPLDIMYLINAIAFDAEWKVIYNKNSIRQDKFTAKDGSKVMTDFMHSGESLYLDDGKATGFIKPYYNNKYSFVALLPNEDVGIDGYIESLSGESLLNTINTAQAMTVNAVMPKFSYEYNTVLNDVLTDLGMPDAFNSTRADFSRLGSSPSGNIYISSVIHKTFISVDERGTKAGAATLVEMNTSGPAEIMTVKLDRPFVYAIIDDSTKLPIFIGTVLNPKG